MFVNRIVVAVPFKALSAQAQQALLAIEKGTTICLDFLAERMGLDGNTESPVEAVPLLSQPGGAQLCAIRPADVDGLMRSPYRRIKRGLDIVGASILWVLLTPVMLLVGALVALDVGLPVMFWQQRPGLGGRPFKLYKFRTMGPAHDREGRPLSDRERLSAVGSFLRRTRLDELPQLLNILLGDMSFVGPRPLLPVDQPADGSARLLVRPGLTGWAQIKGGRAISAADKAALDLWYVQHASFALDLKIALATVPMVIFGERVSEAAVLQAWHDLQLAGASSSRDLRTSRRGRLALSRM